MRLKVFLIEDNPVIRSNLIEVLDELASSKVVGWAATEKDAVDWLHRNRNAWEIAVVDLFLETGSGLGVLEQCRSRHSSQKMVVLSNYVGGPIRERCVSLGADAVFDKSQEFDEFAEFIKVAVRSDIEPTGFSGL